MIEKIVMRNFRNFSEREISFSWGKNIIIWQNGKGKTNILEALCIPASPLVESQNEYLLERGKDVFFVSYTLSSWAAAFSYDHENKKKKYMLSGKSTTKAKLKDFYPHVISFHPMAMNMMYLWPTHRRDFLDEVLSQSFSSYKKALVKYKKIVHSRNKVLKNISEGKSEVSELAFWDESFIAGSKYIYEHRKKIVDFFHENADSLKKYFFGKVDKIEFSYITKTDLDNVEISLKNYIETNREKEILLRKTLRGAHLDDFDILVDGTPLIHFASRGEVKSVILWLKFLETDFIESNSDKTEILFLIDDLLSELDEKHRDLLWEHIWERQSIITSIDDSIPTGNKIFI